MMSGLEDLEPEVSNLWDCNHHFDYNKTVRRYKGGTIRRRYCLFLNKRLVTYSSSKIKGYSRQKHKKSLQQRRRMSLKQFINDEIAEISSSSEEYECNHYISDYNILSRHSPTKHSISLKSDHGYIPCGGKYINYYPKYKHSSKAIKRGYLKEPIFYNLQFMSHLINDS